MADLTLARLRDLLTNMRKEYIHSRERNPYTGTKALVEPADFAALVKALEASQALLRERGKCNGCAGNGRITVRPRAEVQLLMRRPAGPYVQACPVCAGTGYEPAIRDIQEQLPWSGNPYSEDFEVDPRAHKDFEHALVHIAKAAGRLFAVVEDLDHGKRIDAVTQVKVREWLADLVICAMRCANTNPHGAFDLECAIVKRLESKNPVFLTMNAAGKVEVVARNSSRRSEDA